MNAHERATNRTAYRRPYRRSMQAILSAARQAESELPALIQLTPPDAAPAGGVVQPAVKTAVARKSDRGEKAGRESRPSPARRITTAGPEDNAPPEKGEGRKAREKGRSRPAAKLSPAGKVSIGGRELQLYPLPAVLETLEPDRPGEQAGFQMLTQFVDSLIFLHEYLNQCSTLAAALSDLAMTLPQFRHAVEGSEGKSLDAQKQAELNLMWRPVKSRLDHLMGWVWGTRHLERRPGERDGEWELRLFNLSENIQELLALPALSNDLSFRLSRLTQDFSKEVLDQMFIANQRVGRVVGQIYTYSTRSLGKSQ